MRVYVLLLAAFVLAHLLARLRASLAGAHDFARGRGAAPAPAPVRARPRARADRARGHARAARRRSTSTSACARRCAGSPYELLARAARDRPRRESRGGAARARRRDVGARPRRPRAAARPLRPGIDLELARGTSSSRWRRSDAARPGAGARRRGSSTRSSAPSSASATRSSSCCIGLLADGHVLLEDYPGLAKTLTARSFAQVTQTGFNRIQFTPDLMPSDVTGSSIWNQRDARLRVPAGPDLHQPPPRRRDQPRPAEDAGRAARGDAGAAGDDRGRHAPARAAVPRARDPEPDRVRGHVPAARGAARPLPAAGLVRLPEPERRVGGALAAARAARGRGRADARSSTGRPCWRSRRRSRTCTSATPSAPTSSISSRRRARARSTDRRREPARQPRRAQARTLQGRARRAATSSRPRT